MPQDKIMLEPLKAGEYDLVNISLIGHDPITKRSYKECCAEWDAANTDLMARFKKLRWWNLPERFRLAREVAILRQRLGI